MMLLNSSMKKIKKSQSQMMLRSI